MNLSVTFFGVLLAMTFAIAEDGMESFQNGLVVHNKGIGGQNTRNGKARFQKDVLDLKPDYVFIYFGLNDALNEPQFVPLDEFVGNLAWMVGEARRAGIKPVLCTIHHVESDLLMTRHKRESYGDEGPNGKIDRYNAEIRRLATENHAPLVDFAKALDQAGGATMNKSCFVRNPANSGAQDGVHLTPDGYRLLAKCFLDAVAPGLKGNETIVCLGDSVTLGAGMKGAGTADGETYPAFLRRLPIGRQP